jgi:hypothetical protein
MGVVGYCDDNINISSVEIELQQMINYYVEYSYNWVRKSMKINVFSSVLDTIKTIMLNFSLIIKK